MAINDSARNMLDSILEIVAKKSSILLTDNDTKRLCKENPELEFMESLCNSNPNTWIRIQPDELELSVNALRKKIGNLPNNFDSSTFMVNELRKYSSSSMELYQASMEFQRLSLEDELEGPITELRYKTKSKELLKIGISFSVFEEIKRKFNKYNIFLDKDCPEVKDWDGVIPLSDLFETEIAPAESKQYFEQRFINYLLENTQDISSMHWRNFERLITQYFSENGYHVVLGKGTKDGGIDIRVWKDESSRQSSPLIIIQCKRHKNMKIGVDLVKSFYADVLFEKAGTGLIATTTNITSGGKKLIKARGYNIEVAESNEIEKMVRELWKNPILER